MPVYFVILSAPRTGSTLLAKTLNSIPEICCHGELLLPGQVRGYRDGFDPFSATRDQRKARSAALLEQRQADPLAFLRSALAAPGDAVGLKVIYSDLLHPRHRRVLDWLLAQPSVRWLHLQRRNPLRRYVSEQVMHAGGAIHSGMGGKAGAPVKITVDIDSFCARSAEISAQRDQIAKLLQDKPSQDVFYEDLSADTGAAMSNACRLLGLDIPPIAITPALKKVGSDDLATSVSNYDELLENACTRRWAQTR